MQGLAGSGSNWMDGVIRGEYALAKKAKGGEKRTLYIEMAANGLFGVGSPTTGMIKQAEIAVFDRDCWDLFWDLKVVVDMAAELGTKNPRGAQALFTANKMINVIDRANPSTWKDARRIAKEFLSKKTGEGQLITRTQAFLESIESRRMSAAAK